LSGVEEITASVARMRAARELPDALLGGTKGMRTAGEKYLPKEPGESVDAYQVRLARSFLFPGYGKTIRDMAGKVFAKPIAVGDDVPEQLRAAMENVDLAGRGIDVFGHEVFVDGLNSGISYILVDMDEAPAAPDGSPVRISVSQQREMQRRPWAVHVHASQVLGWRTETVGGIERLTQFRFMERVTEDDGAYSEKLVEQIRAFIREGDAVRWEVHRKATSGVWTLHASGIVTIGEIAVCPVYVNRTGFMEGAPALSDLAEVNQAHWQSQSDQRNILHVARVPILFGSGMDDNNGPLQIGAFRMIRAERADAKLGYVEHSGRAIDAGRTDLKDLEFQMQTLGLELLVPRPGSETATGASIDQARMNTPLAMMANALKDALEQMLGFMALYEGLPRDSGGGSLTVNTDFGINLRGAVDMTALLDATKNGVISRETCIREFKRRGILSDDVDPEDEVLKALDEGMTDLPSPVDPAGALGADAP